MTTKADWDNRVREISRWSKVRLAARVREHGTLVWSVAPPEKWSHDELVSEVLRIEFPEGVTT